MDAYRPHLRALQLVDELHRVGFEQLRFTRNASGADQIYADRTEALA